METLNLTLADSDAPRRLDAALAAARPDISRARFQKLIRAGHVRVGGDIADDPSARVAGGLDVTVTLPPLWMLSVPSPPGCS